MKIITICGSLKYQNHMMILAEKLAKEGHCILTPIYLTNNQKEITNEQLELLKKEHLKRIELSDAIVVVNVNNYIGKSTQLEIEYAKKLNKEILYYTNIEGLYNEINKD